MGQEGHVRMLEGRLHAYHVGVGLRIDEARVSIAGRAPDARALPPLALVQHDPAEVLTPQPEERGAEELGVAAHVVVRVRMKGLAVAIAPHLRRCVTALQIDRLGVPVLLLPRHEATPLEDEDTLARRGQRVKERAAAGSGPDDDHVIVGGHEDLLLRPRAWRPRPSGWSWRARLPAR